MLYISFDCQKNQWIKSTLIEMLYGDFFRQPSELLL